MKKLLFISLAIFTITFTSCDNKAAVEKKVKEDYEQDAQLRARKAADDWHMDEKRINIACGIYSDVREERKKALYNLMVSYPDYERWEDVNKCIDNDKEYERYRDIIYELKKRNGIDDI